MTELDPLLGDLRALLEAEAGREEPPVEARDRVLLRLGASVGAALPLGASPRPAEAAALRHVGRAARLARAATIFVAGAASGAGGYRAVQHARRPPPPVVASAPPAPAPPTPAIVAPPVFLTPPPAPHEPPVVHPRRPAAASAWAAQAQGQGDDRLAAERTLLEIARVALVRDQVDGALAALARHEAAFPRGELAEEREGLFVQALVAARRYDEARARAARFTRRYPRSLFAPVVTQALGSIP